MNRTEFDQIVEWAEPHSRVLDLGCGDGTLMQLLHTNRQVSGYGLEIDPAHIQSCIEINVPVIEQDLNHGLGRFDDHSFDLVIMSHTLQRMRRPDLTLQEILRVGKHCVVVIPNFGHWMARAQLLFKGAMPRYDNIPFEWYDTPNTHFCTINDFFELCDDLGIEILDQLYLNVRGQSSFLAKLWPNLFTQTAVFHLSRNP